MFCQKCGTENRNDASFCNSCGAPLNQKPNPVQPASAPHQVSNTSTTIVSANPPEKKERGIFFWGAVIIGIIFVLVIISAIIAAFTFGMAGNTQTIPISKITIISTSPTPIPTVAPPQDPIIGTWMASASGTDVKVRFDANGTQSWIMHTPDKGTWEGYGTWRAQGGNSYITTELKGGHYYYTYEPKQNVIFTDNFPTFLYYPYHEGMAAASTVVESSPKPTTITSISGDKAALDKMSEMNTWMSPTVSIIGDSLTNGDYLKAGLNAVLLRNYIDQSLPEMKQLVNGAGTKKAAAQEYVLYLNDVRSAADKVVRSADKYNAGDYEGSTSLSYSGITDLNNAQAHLSRSTALL
jgi:hypothetical protein